AANAARQSYYETQQKTIANSPLSLSEAIDRGCDLLSPEKSIYHTQGVGNEYNRKYVCENGGEAVFNIYGGLVTDPLNRGTFNAGPDPSSTKHVVFDVVPFYVFGTGPDDETSFIDRLAAPSLVYERRLNSGVY